MNTYISQFDVLRSPTGLETASLLGNSLRLTSAVSIGATSLPVTPSTTVALSQFDQLTIFDGTSSEVVTVASTTNTGSSTITIGSPGLTNAHAQYTPLCSDGILGSLADMIVDATAWVESICYQSLLATTYTNELLAMPTMRAAIDGDGQLTFRPRHWPISSISALAIAWTPSLVITYDPTQIFIDGDTRLCSVPDLIMLPGNQNQNTNLLQAPSRSRKGQVQVTYQAGYAYSALPGDVKDAVVLVVSDALSRRQNPTGADSISLGGKNLHSSPRDLTGESRILKQARAKLSKYSTQMY